MKKTLPLAVLALGLSATAAVAGDAEAGEALWRNCRSCHMIVDHDGATIQRGGRTGPNLYGLPGRPVAAIDGFRYSEALRRYAATGATWSEAQFVEYLSNPTEFLRTHLGDRSARSGMNYTLASGAADMYAYLQSVSGQ